MISLRNKFFSEDNVNEKLIYEGESFKTYKYSSFEIRDKGKWSFDDSPYICTSDMLDLLYDNFYLNLPNIWVGEKYLRQKFDKINIPVILTDEILFRNFNIMGKTISKKDLDLNILKRKKLLDI